MEYNNLSYYKSTLFMERLRKLGSYYDAFSEPSFLFREGPTLSLFGTILIEEEGDYENLAVDFIKTCLEDKWITSLFDWNSWSKGDGKAYFDDIDLIGNADAVELSKILTVIFRRDHRSRGYLVDTFRDGLLLMVLKRAKELSALETFQEVA